MDELLPPTPPQTLEERVAFLEKNMWFILKSGAHTHQEMLGLKKALRESVALIQQGNVDAGIKMILHECRWFWMTEDEEIKFVASFKK